MLCIIKMKMEQNLNAQPVDYVTPSLTTPMQQRRDLDKIVSSTNLGIVEEKKTNLKQKSSLKINMIWECHCIETQLKRF